MVRLRMKPGSGRLWLIVRLKATSVRVASSGRSTYWASWPVCIRPSMRCHDMPLGLCS